MFNGAISVRISSGNQILAIRAKARWLMEKIGFDKIRAGVLSTIISGIARLILSHAKSGRIDVLSVNHEMKRGITILAFLENTDKTENKRLEIESKMYEKKSILNRTDFGSLTAKKIIDEYKIFPTANNEQIMQLTKWM